MEFSRIAPVPAIRSHSEYYPVPRSSEHLKRNLYFLPEVHYRSAVLPHLFHSDWSRHLSVREAAN